MTEKDKNRFERQLIVQGFGEAEQERLRAACVLVVGAGGLGSAVLSYLTAAGVGRIGIVEFDTVSISNLQRQILYATPDLGRSKAEVAAERLTAINPDIQIVAFPIRLTDENAEAIFRDFDLIVDCTDNYAARYTIDRCCGKLKLPMIYGTAQETVGQVSVFHAWGAGGYADLYPRAKAGADVVPVGVLSPMPGIVGSIQAMEVIKLITGYGETLAGRLLMIDAKTMAFSVFDI
jgi:adenylyltransferase/sulfurtransferase